MPKRKKKKKKKKEKPIGLTWDKVKVGMTIKKNRETAHVPEYKMNLEWGGSGEQAMYEGVTCLGLMLNVIDKNDQFKYVTCTLHSIPVTEIRKKCQNYMIRDYFLPDWDAVDAPIGGFVTYETALNIAKALGAYQDDSN